MPKDDRGFLAKYRLYWLYMPLFWLLLLGAALVFMSGKDIIPFFYRAI